MLSITLMKHEISWKKLNKKTTYPGVLQDGHLGTLNRALPLMLYTHTHKPYCQCWKHSLVTLVHADSIAQRHADSTAIPADCDHTCMLRTSHSSSSQRYSMGLLSGECACDCNRLKSPLHSWNQLEMMHALRHITLTVTIKECTWSAAMFRYDVPFK